MEPIVAFENLTVPLLDPGNPHPIGLLENHMQYIFQPACADIKLHAQQIGDHYHS